MSRAARFAPSESRARCAAASRSLRRGGRATRACWLLLPREQLVIAQPEPARAACRLAEQASAVRRSPVSSASRPDSAADQRALGRIFAPPPAARARAPSRAARSREGSRSARRRAPSHRRPHPRCDRLQRGVMLARSPAPQRRSRPATARCAPAARRHGPRLGRERTGCAASARACLGELALRTQRRGLSSSGAGCASLTGKRKPLAAPGSRSSTKRAAPGTRSR